MARCEVKGVQVNYHVQGAGEAVLLLHGWGQNMQMMQAIEDHLAKDFQVYNLDFPGFGESILPQSAWGVFDYAEFIHEFVLHHQLTNPILIGHSFGCRVAIAYASKYPVKKMVLTGAAGLRSKPTLSQQMKSKTFKVGKKLVQMTGSKAAEEALKNHFGSTDYKNTSGILREIFVKVVNEDLSEYLDKFDCPVLLVWGEKDEATPLWMGKVMEEKMKNAGLAIFEGDDHYAYFHQAGRFNLVLDAFFSKDKEQKA